MLLLKNLLQVPDKVQDDDVAEKATKNVAEKDTTVPEMVETVSSIVDDELK
jgi:hypothetical protein